MFANRRRPRLAQAAVAGAAALLAVGIAACTSSTTSPSGAAGSPTATGNKLQGGTVSIALPPSTTNTFIWPFIPLAQSSTYVTIQWQWLMYRPLYMFGGNAN